MKDTDTVSGRILSQEILHEEIEGSFPFRERIDEPRGLQTVTGSCR
jgi:hypothetical protein